MSLCSCARFGTAPLALACAVAATLSSTASVSMASSYASGITESNGTVSFTLNEAATDVTIVRDGVPVSLGALPKGAHTFQRSGAASYYVQVSKAASSGYTQISTNSTANNFELPRGVGVNTNASLNGAPNPYFGRVYVSNARESNTAAGRSMTSGFYLLNSDLSSVASAKTGGITWLPAATDPTGSSPFRVQVGPDNNLYVADWSNSHSGVWAVDPDGDSAVEVLGGGTRDAAGLNNVHGSVSDVVVVGTGAARKIYTVDEDFPNSTSGQRNSVLRYDIGTTPTYTGAPTVFYDDAANGNRLINSQNSLAVADDGTWWVSQLRNPAASQTGLVEPSVVQVSADGSTVLWTSLSLAANGDSITDPLRNAQGLAYDPVNDVIAVVTAQAVTGTGTGLVQILDQDTRSILQSFFFALSGSSTNCDVAFDAAGNLYVTNRSAERLHVWSPGGDSLWTSGSDGSFFAAAAPVPEPAGIALLGIAGLALCHRRRRA